MGTRIWILGASDPEMVRIEARLVAAGERTAYATRGGARVHPGNAYGVGVAGMGGAARIARADEVILVECDCDLPPGDVPLRRCDHHRPGDPGYGRPAAEYAAASSIGQVREILAGTCRYCCSSSAPCDECYDPRGHGHSCPELCGGCGGALTADEALAAAADHCLAAAYAGECPGVALADLLAWRIRERAAFQRRPEADVAADVARATEALSAAPRVKLLVGVFGPGCEQAHPDHPEAGCSGCWGASPGIDVADLRGLDIPELPEAAARLGIAFLATPRPGPDGRQKVVLQADVSGDACRAFLGGWAASQGLVELYGDPARGFAGGYKA